MQIGPSTRGFRGGKDMQTLLITASKGLYAIRTQVKGAGSQ